MLPRDHGAGPTLAKNMRKILIPLALLLAASSCNTVEFYEKRELSSPVMDMGQERTLSAFHQKVHYSTEGAAGGLGTTAGGGCGCY